MEEQISVQQECLECCSTKESGRQLTGSERILELGVTDRSVVVATGGGGRCFDLPFRKNWPSLVVQMLKNLPAMQETWV